LVTALIIDAYKSIAAELAKTGRAFFKDNLERIKATAICFREWALKNPEQYALICGTPIPGYNAPHDVIAPYAAYSMLFLVSLLDISYQEGKIDIHEPAPEETILLIPWAQQINYSGPVNIIQYAVTIWAKLHRLVSLELFGHISVVSKQTDFRPIFEAELENMFSMIEK